MRLPAQSQLEHSAQLAPVLEQDFAAGKGRLQLGNEPGRMIGVIGHLIPRGPRLLFVIVS